MPKKTNRGAQPRHQAPPRFRTHITQIAPEFERFYLQHNDMPWRASDAWCCAHTLLGGPGSRPGWGDRRHEHCCITCMRREHDHAIHMPRTPAGRVALVQAYASPVRHIEFTREFAARWGIQAIPIASSERHGSSAVLYVRRDVDPDGLLELTGELWHLWQRLVVLRGAK